MRRIVVVGAGFAGLWSALAAARLLDMHAASDIEVAVIAPEPVLKVRPRLYEDNPGAMEAPLLPLFRETGIRFVRGTVDAVDTHAQKVSIVAPTGDRSDLTYNRLVLASGSQLYRPDIPGLRDYAFSIDQRDEAAEFEAHLKGLAQKPHTPARNTVVVIGGGFTGIELAAELPARLRRLLGEAANCRTIVIERADEIGPELGATPRPIIREALHSQGVELRLGTSVARADGEGIVTSTGERIAAQTVVLTAGMRASPLTGQIPAERDELGRVVVDRDLRVPSVPTVFAAGDVGRAATDDAGHVTLMSCQHALLLGRSAGNNAAADLLGVPGLPYAQPQYGTTLDLGPWGALQTQGWDRVIQAAGPEVKAAKHFINSKLIYPPSADRKIAFEAANPVIDIARRKELART